MSSVVELNDVCFSYYTNEILHNVNVLVEDGSFVAVVGPNGGGKTTLLRLIVGQTAPTRGTVRVLGSNPRLSPPPVGYVMQSLMYDPAFPASAMDIVLMGRANRHLFGPYRAADRDAAHEALQRVGMDGTSRKSFSELSGGQRQRVLIAQALAANPRILLLDEPTANVDPEGERSIFELLGKLRESMNIIVVSHNVNVVVGAATHVLCVNRTAVMNPLDSLNPTLIDAGKNTQTAILQHAMSCHVLDPSRAMQTPHLHEHPGESR